MNSFPLEFTNHIRFCIIGIAFFLVQYARQGFKYQLLSAAAIGMTLLLYISDNEIFRNAIGIIELIIIIAIFILSSSEKKKLEKEKKEKEVQASTETIEESETEIKSGENINE